jgi:adenosylmethionine-8-amino-7-oxononanoate aminotransferase
MTAISPLAEFFMPVDSWGDLSNEAVTAEGSRVTFADGTEAICAVSGLWNSSLGYGNRAIADAIHEANTRASTLPLFRRGNTIAREAASALLDFARPHHFATCWFSTSGSAALDTTVKLVRQYQALRGETARKRIVSFSGSYHGMTAAAMATTGEYLQQDVYGIDQRLHIRIPHDDPDAFERVTSRYGHELAAVILEPVLGSGAFVVDENMIDTIFKWRATHGFAVVADEVATGFHRTGPRFASHGWKVQPDILVTSKALTNGTCAAAALLVSHAIVERFRETGAVFWHGETQAGSPQSAAAAVATIREFVRLDVARQSARVSERLDSFLAELSADSDRVTTTGVGCFRAIHLRGGAGEALDSGRVAELVRRARAAGVIVQPGPSCVQLIPNLVMSDPDLDDLFQRLKAMLRRWLDEAR